MKCPGCDRELRTFELAQPMTMNGLTLRPHSFCDTCCRTNLWPGGNPEALERLMAGKIDAHATVELANLTRDWIPAYHEALPTGPPTSPNDDIPY